MPYFPWTRPSNPSPNVRASIRTSNAAVIAAALVTVGCGSGGSESIGGARRSVVFSVDHRLASDIDPTAPTTVGIVRFSVDGADVTEASIEFGLDTSYGMRAPVDLSAPEYRTLLLGMKPARQYHYRIRVNEGDTTFTSDDYVLETGAPTTLVSIGGFNVLNDAARERGFIIASCRRFEGQLLRVPFILDADGDIVWWYARGTEGISHAVMSRDGKNLWMVAPDNSGAPIQRVTMDGLDEQTYEGTAGSHDISAVSGATMAFADYRESDCDSITEIDPSGAVREAFESEGLVDPDAGIVGCHGNAVRYWPELDAYSFSDRHQDIIFADREDGSVLWRLAENVEGGNTAWGEEQHGHHLAGDRLLVFANAGGGPDTSAIFEYTMEGEETFRYVGQQHTEHHGDVQRLPGGNILITYSNASIIHEIDSEQNVVLEIDGGGRFFGYSTWTDTLYPQASTSP